MKKVLLLASIVAMFSNLNAQSWQEFQKDDFESYTAGDYIGVASDNFTTWSGTTGTTEDAFVIDSVTTPSGSNCILINSTSQDMVWDLGLQEKGAFEVQFKYMVGVGKGGYFNFQKEPTPGVEWGGEIYFASDGTGYFSHAALTEDIAITHTNGEWMTIYAIISLDTEMAMLYIGDNEVIEYTFSLSSGSGAAGLNTLGAVNFYGAAAAGDDPEYYVDDVTFTRLGAQSAFNQTMEVGMPGMYAAESMGGAWDTWTGAPGTGEDALVSNAMSNGGLNSIYFSEATTDLIYRFGDQTEGRWELSFDIYVEAGAGAYYNLMHDFDGAFEWALEVVFNGDGTGVHSGGMIEVNFDYTEDAWNRIEYIIDLDNDNAKFFMNGMKMQDWQWSLNDGTGGPGLNQLAVMDIFPAGSAAPSYYIDNLNVQLLSSMEATGIEHEDLAAFNAGEYFAQGNPGWSTWTDSPGSGEDGFISDEMAFSGEKSLELTGGLGQDVIYRFGNATSGAFDAEMMCYVPADGDGYFNLMHEFDNVANAYMWALDVYMENGGSGYIHAGGESSAATFDYPVDEWFPIHVYIDMDNDYAHLYINDVMVHAWQWSLDAQDAGASLNQLAVMDLFPPNATSHYYFDDISFSVGESGLTVNENFDTELSIYPNPANDVVYIVNDINEEVNLHIYNAAGQEMTNVQRIVNNGVIEISTADLINGIYLIQLENENNRITKRIVVQH